MIIILVNFDAIEKMNSLTNINLLVVDQSLLIKEAIKSIFEKSDYVKIIGSCNKGGDVISFLKANKTDVILMDVLKKDSDDLNAIIRIKKYNSKIKIIGFSLRCYPDFVKDILDAGADGFISKYDFTIDDMERELMRVTRFK